ncbi:MAG: hypothetical protein LBL21_03085 [Rickettsiales bacterium]|jgi:hypothetical protein|nr:hypothetical protein [Rickettsiales bacterium]
MRKVLRIVFCALAASSCQLNKGGNHDTVQVVENLVVDEHSVPIYPRKAALTTDTARRFSLELPRRCRVDWDNQNVLSVLPEETVEMTRLDAGDRLPPFNVEDYKFERKTVAEALAALLEGTKIQIIEDQEIPDRIAADIKSGSLADAAELLSKMVRSYYYYDEDAAELHLTNHARWLVKMPKDETVVMALVDALHGADLSNMVINWEDKTLAFDGNYQTEKEARRVISDIGSRNFLIAYDMDVYRVYPRTENPIVWMNILPAFGGKNVKMSIPGVMGRALVVSPEINTKTLQTFLAQQANVVLISEGSFAIPNGWSSRFDIGQCTKEERLETDLIVGARGKYGDYAGKKKVESKIVLRTQNGEVANFNVPTNMGDNMVIVGIPTHAFVEDPETTISPFAELVVFISPKVISIIPGDEADAEPLSGKDLREYLEE